MSEARAGRGGGGGEGSGGGVPPPPGRVGTVIAGKWKVEARIGRGGMATVYAVTHRSGRRAALKMLHTQLSRDAPTRARFLREGYVANAVGHPGVVGVLDDGIAEDGSAYLVLELLEGETMEARRVRLGGQLPLDEALDIADEALDALGAAHEKGIVHRDVKPDNVFLTNAGKVKLLDFGLARMKDGKGEVTRTGVTIGTPEFMPPEQAMGRRDSVDARSDVWGLGATLFTAITGRYVHEDAPTLREQLVASATQRSQPIRTFAPHVTPEVAAVVDCALELEMNDRWQSAIEMREALRDARGRERTPFTVDTARKTSAAFPRSAPISLDKPGSSDKTVEMSAPPGSLEKPRSMEVPEPSSTEPSLDASELAHTYVESSYASRPPSFRAPILTPSTEHETIASVPAAPPARAAPPDFRAEDAHAVTMMADSFPVDPSPAPFAVAQTRTHPIALPLHPGTSYPSGSYPSSHRFTPPPIPHRPSSARAVLIVSVLLLLLCAAMGAYVLWSTLPAHG